MSEIIKINEENKNSSERGRKNNKLMENIWKKKLIKTILTVWSATQNKF